MDTLAGQIRDRFQARNVILYDGECIYCQKYTAFLKLRETLGPVELVDLRGVPEIVGALREAGLDPNDGMVFVDSAGLYHGDEAVIVLAAYSTPSGLFNRLNRMIFRHRPVARLLLSGAETRPPRYACAARPDADPMTGL